MMTMDVHLKSEICKGLKRLAEDKKLLLNASRLENTGQPSCKSHQASDMTREKGNKLLGRGNLDNEKLHEILCLYNESIAYALAESEGMAKAFANKSAVLLRLRKYKESISEADKALRITTLDSLKVKLLCRKAECLTALGSSKNKSCLEKARSTLLKSEDAVTANETLMKFIQKAQLVVDKQKSDKPKGNKRLTAVSQIIANEEDKGIWKSVEIKHSDKYGRHLVASRDFEAGDILLVEKTYSNHLKESRMYQYCCKCFNYLWTVTPCEQCCWRLFCSEECKSQAWKQYHNLECSLVSHMKLVFPNQWNDEISSKLTIFFKTLEEAGSIGELQRVFESSQNKDQCSNDLDYKTLLAVTTCELTKEEMETHLHSSVMALIGLARFTTILGKSYGFDEIEELMKDDAAIFVGRLLLKFSAVIISGCATVKLRDPTAPELSRRITMARNSGYNDDDLKNPVINLMSMLTLVGCIPNVEACRTIGNKSVIFALQRIKAGTPLIMYKRSFSYLHSTPKDMRESKYRKYYKSSCNCRACTGNWDTELFSGASSPLQLSFGPKNELTKKFGDEFMSVASQLSANTVYDRKLDYPDIEAVFRVKNMVAEGWKLYSMPSNVLIFVTNVLVSAMEEFYDPHKSTFTYP